MSHQTFRKDLNVVYVKDVIQEQSSKHEDRLETHTKHYFINYYSQQTQQPLEKDLWMEKTLYST